MSAEKIAAVLEAHRIGASINDLKGFGIICHCGDEFKDVFTDHALIAHTAHQAAALEPVIRERERVAWREGFKQGGPMHDVNYDDPDAHTRNPYDGPTP